MDGEKFFNKNQDIYFPPNFYTSGRFFHQDIPFLLVKSLMKFDTLEVASPVYLAMVHIYIKRLFLVFM